MVLGKQRKKKAEICTECHKSTNPGIQAARSGHEQCLVTAYRQLGVFNERDNFGATPIHYAARYGHLDCLKWLVEKSGISPNAVSESGMTAAHDAAAMGQLECLQLLLGDGRCSARDRTLEGASVVHVACRFGRLDALRWLVEGGHSSWCEKGGNDVTPVHLCAARDQLSSLQYLVGRTDYEANQVTVHGATPVYFAAQEGSVECLRWLVMNGGGDPNVAADDGMHPIHAAAQAGQLECLRWLVDVACVPVRRKAEDGATPAHYAAASGKVQCLEWLLNQGALVSDTDKLGGTPLHDAAEQGHAGALDLLLRHGGDLGQRDAEGVQPLDLAKENQHEDCIRLLFRQTLPSIVTSVVPHHPQNRSAAVDDNLRQEKQRAFEETLLSGVSPLKVKEMWEEAQKESGTPTPGLKTLLDTGSTDMLRLRPSLRGNRSAKSSSRSASSYKEGHTEGEAGGGGGGKQRPLLSAKMFDTPPISNLDISKLDSRPVSSLNIAQRVDSRPHLEGRYAEMVDLVDPTLVDKKRSTFHEKENQTAKEDPVEQPSKGLKRSNSFLRWIKRKMSSSDDSSKMEGLQDSPAKKQGTKLKKKTSKSAVQDSLPLKVLEENIPKEIQQPEVTSVQQDDEKNVQEMENVVQDDQQVVQDPGTKVQFNMEVASDGEVTLEQSLDTAEVLNARSNPELLQHDETPTENDSLSHSLDEKEAKRSKKRKPVRQPSAEKIVFREGDKKDVNIDFIKLRSFYHKRYSQLNDSDFSSPEPSDSEEPSIKRTHSQFEKFGMEVGDDGIPVGPKRTISRQLEEDFDEFLPDTSVTTPPGREEGVVSSMSDITDPNDLDVPIEVGINIDFESSDIVNISFRDKPTSTPRPPSAKGVVSMATAPSSDDDKIQEEGEVDEKKRRGLERKLSVKEMAQRLSTSIPMGGPHIRTVTQIKRASSLGPDGEDDLGPTSSSKLAEVGWEEAEDDMYREPILVLPYPPPPMENEGGDVLTPLKRIPSSNSRTQPQSHSERGRIDGLGGGVAGGSSDKSVARDSSPIKRTLSPPSGAMLSTFMHTSDSKYLKMVKSQHEEDQNNLALRTAQELLHSAVPQDSFEQSLQHHIATGNTGPKVFEMPASTPEGHPPYKESVCIQVESTYPPQAHVFLHSDHEVPSLKAEELVKKIVHSAPGKAIVYREVVGHESLLFAGHFPSEVEDDPKPFVNVCVPGVLQLYRYSNGKFHEEALNYFSLTEGDVFILDTPTKLFVRVNPSTWDNEEISIFSIAQQFIQRQEYPAWTSIVIATKYGEPPEFTCMFLSWPYADLRLAAMATEMNLPADFSSNTPFPSAGRVKVWALKEGGKELLTLDKFGHFDSSLCYLTDYGRSGNHELYLWAGCLVQWSTLAVHAMGVVKEHRKEIAGTSQLVVIPEGAETERYLNIFKGKYIIHNPTYQGPTHLFRVSGRSALRLSAREVCPAPSSLHSSHSFVAYTGERMFVWSGQFSLTYERRGTLIISRMLDSDFFEPTGMIPEGQETEEFWDLIGGKGPHPFVDPSQLPEYTPGGLYLYDQDQQYSRRLNYTKQDLKGSLTFVLWKGSQLFIWQGSQTSRSLALDIAADFVTKFCPSKTLVRDFVVSMETDGAESREFWQLFNLSQKAAEQAANRVIPASVTDQRGEKGSGTREGGGDKGGMEAVDVLDGRAGALNLSNILDQGDQSILDVSLSSKANVKRMSKDQSMLVVPVQSHYGRRALVSLSSEAVVGSVLLKLAALLKMELSRDLALFEVLDELRIERQIEDHEVVGSVVTKWPKKNFGRLVLREVHGKYRLWTHPPLAKNDIREFLRRNQIPSLYSNFGFVRLNKTKWKNQTLTLNHDGIYSVVLKGQGLKSGACICSLEGHDLYMPLQPRTPQATALRGITNFSFILKSASSCKPKDMVMFSAGDETTLKTWIEAIKLVKFGAQLKSNYKAMTSLLRQQQEEDIPKVLQADTPVSHSHFTIETSQL